uniref:Transmembrane protein 14C n=1 Tax=Chlamydomonas euryale TaxID=1486919 RepID=A0A7R9V9Q8_9CHLO|mmetsp:Transcript_279/g.713  ORF Transcript_279/g.713 Transcript_279/m.713 type:complete len:110 (+) Transcript_279:226-555(+)
MAPTGQAHLDIALAALCAGGGVVGYLKKGSLPSLLGGVAFSGAYALSGYYINTVDAVRGHQMGAATSLLLAGVMGARLVKTKKVMPAGLLAGTGALGLLYHLKKYQEWA